MPEFEIDQESATLAERVASRLLGDLREVSPDRPLSALRGELFSAQRYSEEETTAPLTDVLTIFPRMAMEFAIARRWDGGVLCMKLGEGELVPISMMGFPDSPRLSLHDLDDWIELVGRYEPVSSPLHRYLQESLPREAFRVIGIQEAEARAQRNVTEFLAYRFAGIKWLAGHLHRKSGPPRSASSSKTTGGGHPLTGTGGGLQVQVFSRTPGLRIHVSPAYFISWVFFGSPTTPVTGYVLPGRYIFAGDGPMLPNFTVDSAVFCIPPTYKPVLMRF